MQRDLYLEVSGSGYLIGQFQYDLHEPLVEGWFTYEFNRQWANRSLRIFSRSSHGGGVLSGRQFQTDRKQTYPREIIGAEIKFVVNRKGITG